MAGAGIHPYHPQQWAAPAAAPPPPTAAAPPPPPNTAVPIPPPPHPHPHPSDDVRTIFISGLPEDVKERELQNLLRWLPGYEASQINYKGEHPMGFALFTTPDFAHAAKDALQNMVFDAESKAVLHTEMAKKNLFVKRGIVADGNAYDQSKRLRTGDYTHTGYASPSPFHPPPAPVWGPHGYMAPPPPPYDAYGGYPVPPVPIPAPAPVPAPSSYVPVQNTKDNPPCNTLFIGNLGENINEEELRGLFSIQPGFKQMKVLRQERHTVCFIEFEDLNSASHVHHNLQGAVIPSSGSVGMRIQALNWLKTHYWDPQKHAIPYQNGKSANVRKEIRSKLRELAFSLKVRQNSGSSSTQAKGNRLKHHEQMVGATIHGRNKFFAIVASKCQPSKYIGSKKQTTRTLKNLVRLYSFFSSDVVFVLLEFLLNSSNSVDVMDSPEIIQMNLSLDVAQAVFDEWKPVISKVCKKEPELLLSLLKAVLDMIDSRMTIRDDFGSEHFSLLQYDSEMQRIRVLSSLFQRLVLVFKGLKITLHKDQENLEDAASCLPRTSLIELVRRCLHISDSVNRELLDSALLLTETVRDGYLKEKLLKLMKLHPRLAEDGVSEVNTSDLNNQNEYLREAAEKLKLVKRHKHSNASVQSTQDDIINDTTIWTIAKSWNPCPIGMLPRTGGSSGCLPVLDNGLDCETNEVLNSMDTEEHIELRHSSKREANSGSKIQNDSSVKRMREAQDSDFTEPENLKASTSPDFIKGSLCIGGVWQKVGNQELQDIKSRVGILVTKRKVEE